MKASFMTTISPSQVRISNFLLLAGLVASLTACGNGEEKVDPFALMEGEAIYKAECANCHGKDMEGQANWQTPGPDGRLPAPPLAGNAPATGKSFEQLVSITRLGMVPPHAPEGHVSNQPAFAGKLTERQLENVVHYIQSRWPAKPAKPAKS